MKKHFLTFLALVCSIILSSCGQGFVSPEYARSSFDYGYSKREVKELKKKLDETSFPKEEGYVKSLLVNDSGVGVYAGTADYWGREDGLLATHTLCYSLDEEYTLVLHQDQYQKGKSPFGSNMVDARAEVLRYRKSDH